MGRTKGAINKMPTVESSNTELSTEERLEFLAELIVDKLLETNTSEKGLPDHIQEAELCTMVNQ